MVAGPNDCLDMSDMPGYPGPRGHINTRVRYMYRDAANYKTGAEVVVQGYFRWRDILKYLDEGEYFIPQDVGLDPVNSWAGDFDEELDHPWHELVDVGTTQDKPTISMTGAELLAAFKTAHESGWPTQHSGWEW